MFFYVFFLHIVKRMRFKVAVASALTIASIIFLYTIKILFFYKIQIHNLPSHFLHIRKNEYIYINNVIKKNI
jgi:hypothetical protein